MFYLGQHYDNDDENQKHVHLFWRSVQIPIYVSVENPLMFDPARHYCFGTHRHFAEVSASEVKDITQAMQVARMAFLQSRFRTSDPCFDHDVRALLGRLDDYRPIWQMNTRQVTEAVLDAVKNGSLIFVPEHQDLRTCVKAIQEDRRMRTAPAAPSPQSDMPSPDHVVYENSPRASRKVDTPSYSLGTKTLLGDATPFEYGEHSPVGEAVQQDAGVFLTPAEEAECELQYNFDMVECGAYAAMDKSAWGMCKERAMNRYANCLRGIG